VRSLAAAYNSATPTGVLAAGLIGWDPQSSVTRRLLTDNAGYLGTAAAYLEISGSTAAANLTAPSSSNCAHYRSFSMQVAGTVTTGGVQVMFSNDNTTFYAVPLVKASVSPATVVPHANAVGLYSGPVLGRYIRCTTTADFSGSTTQTLELSGAPAPVALQSVEEQPTGTATLTSVASSASTGVLLAAKAARRGAVIVNESTAVLYLAYAATASLTAYTYAVPAGSTFEMPRPAYTGAISGIWSAANGSARVTELG
jgi:hypothetical protein